MRLEVIDRKNLRERSVAEERICHRFASGRVRSRGIYLATVISAGGVTPPSGSAPGLRATHF